MLLSRWYWKAIVLGLLIQTSAAQAVAKNPAKDIKFGALPQTHFDQIFLQQKTQLAAQYPDGFPGATIVTNRFFSTQLSKQAGAQTVLGPMQFEPFSVGFETLVLIDPWININFSGALKTEAEAPGYNGLSLNRAAIILGNLSVSPLYGTLGLFHVPFGRYITEGAGLSTKLLHPRAQQSFAIGYKPVLSDGAHINLSCFGFNPGTSGATTAGSGYGLNFEYNLNKESWSMLGGVSYLNNLFGNRFFRYSDTVAGIDFYTSLKTGALKFNAEYIRATTNVPYLLSVDSNTATFPEAGHWKTVQPHVWYGEVAFAFYDKVMNPASIIVAYEYAKDTVNISSTQSRWIIAMKTKMSDNVAVKFLLSRQSPYTDKDNLWVYNPANGEQFSKTPFSGHSGGDTYMSSVQLNIVF